MKKNLIFIGAPGSGKGTQSKVLCDKLSYNHISTGDLLRKEVRSLSGLGKKIQEVMKKGQLVPDDLVTDLLTNNIDLVNNQYIFDGFPRNIEQATILSDKILRNHGYHAIYFELDLEELTKRIVNRRVSVDGKNIYNLITNPPKQEGICDLTGSKLIQRKDDTEEVVNKRIKVYKDETAPMLDYYRKKKLLKTIDAERNIDEVTEQLKNIIEEES